jgi:RNA polymerase sigma-70 factor, ECF subfamily
MIGEDRYDAYVSCIYVQHYRMLVHALKRYTRDAEDAEDLAQEAFVRMIAARSEPEHPRAWLRRTGYRLFVDQLRRRSRAGSGRAGEAAVFAGSELGEVAWLPGGMTPEEAWLAEEFRLLAEGLLQQLRKKERLIIHYRMQDHTYRQIAERMRCPSNTVRTIARRTRLRMLPLLQDDN